MNLNLERENREVLKELKWLLKDEASKPQLIYETSLVLLFIMFKIPQTSCDRLLAEDEGNCFKRWRGSILANAY